MSMQPGPVRPTPVQTPEVRAGAGGRVLPAAQTGSGTAVRDVQSPQPAPGVAAEQLQRATEALQRRLSQVAPELQFSVDQDSGRSIVKITDPATHEVIRQIPSEEILRISKEIDRYQGLLLNRKG